MAIKSSFVVLGAITALLIALVASGYPPSRAEADVDATGAVLLPWGKQQPGGVQWALLARNVVLGEPIVVCTDDYPMATHEAVGLWNAGLRGQDYIEHNVFTATCSDLPDHTDRISYVSIEAHLPGDPDFFCDNSTARGCLLVSPRLVDPLHTLAGHTRVIMNEDLRSPSHDLAGDSSLGYRRVRRTIAHELGHVLGLGDHGCVRTTNALMTCSYETPVFAAAAPTDTDYDNYEALYEPNPVTALQDTVGGDIPRAENVPGHPGSVRFRFNASAVAAESRIEIRAKEPDGTWSPDVLKSFGPESTQIDWVATGQSAGMRIYGVFVTTQAYLDGQATAVDPMTPGTPMNIGFLQEELPVTVPMSPTTFDISLTVVGGGDVAITPEGPYSSVGSPTVVTLTATWNINTHVFIGWGDHCAVLPATISPTDLTCVLAMNGNKTVTATFGPVRHTLTVTVKGDDGGNRGVTPGAGEHMYNHGTIVRLKANWDATTHLLAGARTVSSTPATNASSRWTESAT